MSIRRSISFSENEKDILEYFDDNGKSDIAKQALKFYKENKDNVLTEAMIRLLKVIGMNQALELQPQKVNMQDKFAKLKK